TVPPELKKRIMAGMTAKLEIMIYENPNALMVPLSSVTEEQGKRFVSRKKAGSAAQKVEVTTGYTTQDAVEILKGLKEGDVIEVVGLSGSGDMSRDGKQ
ncbi:MAG: hypothetical protein PHH91_07365, partial [Desulfuromonadaceae bacterium]|nr:hypothetical protein [Desulfuromonadaceae bacterium]